MFCFWTMNVLLNEPDAESFQIWHNSKQESKKNQIMTGSVIHSIPTLGITFDRHGAKQ